MKKNLSLTLTPRLALAASMVRPGVRLADIGTDHAYLPVWLLLQGKIFSAVAADIREGPLQSAAATVGKYGLAGKIKLMLSDGLQNISEEECDDIVIAGMGGEMITSIMERTEWLKNGGKRLILQPMTMQEILRCYLFSYGFSILEERAVCEGFRPYTVILAQYTGQNTVPSPLNLYAGALPSFMDTDAERYLKKEIIKLSNKLKRFDKEKKDEDFFFLSRAKNELEKLVFEFGQKEASK